MSSYSLCDVVQGDADILVYSWAEEPENTMDVLCLSQSVTRSAIFFDKQLDAHSPAINTNNE